MLLLEHPYSKEQIPPRNMPPVETCPMGELGSRSSPLCSMRNQVAGLHHHFQSEQHHILCGRLRKQHETQQGPHKICCYAKNMLQRPYVLLMHSLCIKPMSWDALFKLSTKILSTGKATKQEHRGSINISTKHGNSKNKPNKKKNHPSNQFR